MKGQINSLNQSNNELNISITNHTNTINDLQNKHNDLKSTYDDLTSLYSKQTFDLDLIKKELKNTQDELNTTSVNNKLLHDELTNIKKETAGYITKIEDLKLQLLNNKPDIPMVQEKQIKISSSLPNNRGIKVSSRR